MMMQIILLIRELLDHDWSATQPMNTRDADVATDITDMSTTLCSDVSPKFLAWSGKNVTGTKKPETRS